MHAMCLNNGSKCPSCTNAFLLVYWYEDSTTLSTFTPLFPTCCDMSSCCSGLWQQLPAGMCRS